MQKGMQGETKKLMVEIRQVAWAVKKYAICTPPEGSQEVLLASYSSNVLIVNHKP